LALSWRMRKGAREFSGKNLLSEVVRRYWSMPWKDNVFRYVNWKWEAVSFPAILNQLFTDDIHVSANREEIGISRCMLWQRMMWF
jgi:hypothetical protein